MSREWKIGDRFKVEVVEGVITVGPDQDGNYRALFDGKLMDSLIIEKKMKHAKLIQPAAPQKLDTSKPMRLKGSGKLAKYRVCK